MVTCPTCKAPVAGSKSFCTKCGTKLTVSPAQSKTCGKCGASMSYWDKSCKACADAAKKPASDEKKQRAEPATSARNATSAVSAASPSKRSGPGKLLMAAAGLVVLAGLAFGALWWFNNELNSDVDPKPTVKPNEIAEPAAGQAKPTAEERRALSSLVGTWQAKIVALDVPLDTGHFPLDVSDAPPMELSIKEQDGNYLLEPASDSRLPPRVLIIRNDRIVSKTSPEISLRLVDDVLVGEFEQNEWRLEFNAQRTD